jgi:hypothetical protein
MTHASQVTRERTGSSSHCMNVDYRHTPRGCRAESVTGTLVSVQWVNGWGGVVQIKELLTISLNLQIQSPARKGHCKPLLIFRNCIPEYEVSS